MENHANEYEFSNIKKIEPKIAAALEIADKEQIRATLAKADNGDGSVSYNVINQILSGKFLLSNFA